MSPDEYPEATPETAASMPNPDVLMHMSPDELGQNGLQTREVTPDMPLSLDLAEHRFIKGNEQSGLVAVLVAGGVPFTLRAGKQGEGKYAATLAPYSAETEKQLHEGNAFTARMAVVMSGVAPTILGRSNRNLVSDAQQAISRKHLSVGITGSVLTVSDLNSKNGTRVITTQERNSNRDGLTVVQNLGGGAIFGS